MNMKCPYCGSNRLAWSEETGYIVCQNCGAIIQSLIDDSTPFHFEDKEYNKTKRNKEEYLPYRNYIIENKVEKAIKRGKIITLSDDGKASISSILDKKLTEIESNKEFVLSYKILEEFPILKSRTKRNKYAIALYVVYRSKGYSKESSISLVSKNLGVSKLTIRNILRKNKESIKQYEDKLNKLINKKELLQ